MQSIYHAGKSKTQSDGAKVWRTSSPFDTLAQIENCRLENLAGDMRLSFAQAKAQYVHRYTMDHVPNWARKPAPNGRFYAPQFRSDLEWYAATLFPGESELAGKRHCYTSGQTWPLGQWLDKPFRQ